MKHILQNRNSRSSRVISGGLLIIVLKVASDAIQSSALLVPFAPEGFVNVMLLEETFRINRERERRVSDNTDGLCSLACLPGSCFVSLYGDQTFMSS